MEKSGFFNADITGYEDDGTPKFDREYLAEDFASYFATFIGNGVFPNPATNLQITANDNMSITLKSGTAWIDGYIYINTDDLIFNIDVADGVLNRIDRIVLRLDFLNREIRTHVKKGQFSSNPVPPALQRDADAHELALADIKINKGAISIRRQDITDLRLNKELCGIVHGLIDQVDTTAIFNQYLKWYQDKQVEYDSNLISWTQLKQEEVVIIKQQFELDFQAWFETIKGILDTEAAGNLFNLVSNLESNLTNLDSSLNTHINDAVLHVTQEDKNRWDNKITENEARNMINSSTEFTLKDMYIIHSSKGV